MYQNFSFTGHGGWVVRVVAWQSSKTAILFWPSFESSIRITVIDDWNIGLRRCPGKKFSLGGPTLKKTILHWSLVLWNNPFWMLQYCDKLKSEKNLLTQKLKQIRLTYFASVRIFSCNEYILFLKSFITIYHFDQFSFNFWFPIHFWSFLSNFWFDRSSLETV